MADRSKAALSLFEKTAEGCEGNGSPAVVGFMAAVKGGEPEAKAAGNEGRRCRGGGAQIGLRTLHEG